MSWNDSYKASTLEGFTVNFEMIYEPSLCTTEHGARWGHFTWMFTGLIGGNEDASNSTNDLTIASSREVFSNISHLTNICEVFAGLQRKHAGLDYNPTCRYTFLRHRTGSGSIGMPLCLKELTLRRGLTFKHGLCRTN